MDADLHLVESLDEAMNFLEWLGREREWLAFDIETTGLNKGRDTIRMCQFGDSTAGWCLPWQDWGGVAKLALERYRGRLVAHNLIFDSAFCKREGVELEQARAHDTMIMAHLLDPVRAIGLKPLASRVLKEPARAGEKIMKEAMRKQGWGYADIPIDFPGYWGYSALDPVLTARLAEKFWPQIQPFMNTYELELGCIHRLRDAELAGLVVDLPYVEAKIIEKQARLAELRPMIPVENPNSPRQVERFLLGRGVKLWKETEHGALSVDDDVLKQASERVPEAALIQEYRLASKLLSSYFENLRDEHVGGVVRPSVKPVGARHGRMSVTSPALQTIPRGTEVRDAFVAREGHSFVMVDFTQMEYRVFACLAGAEDILEGFRRGDDFHDSTAKQLFGEGWTKEQRQICKNANFAKLFGAQPPTFAATAGISVEEGYAFIEKYDQAFPDVSRYQEEMSAEVVRTAGRSRMGYIHTADGRQVPVEKQKAYKAVNYKVSGSCAGVLKKKIIELDAAGLGDFFRLPIHDEVMLEVPDDLLEEVVPVATEVMTDRTWPVELTVDCEVEKRWGDTYRE